jgi:ABC-2 type transport system ATP-binding protein
MKASETMPHESVVTWDGVSKRRGKQQALSGFSLALAPGRVCGLIGPNGAGKTTAIELLLGLLKPDAGSVRVFGEPALPLPWQLRQRIGFLSERSQKGDLPNLMLPALLDWQSCHFADWDQAWCDELVQRLGAVPDQPMWQLSEGQRRRAEMVVALAHRPSLLVLDDPALGLDALARRDLLWQTIDAVRDMGTTVLFTSHVLQDVERVVDDVCILNGGRTLLAAPLEELQSRSKRILLDADHVSPQPILGELHRRRRGREVEILTIDFSPALVASLAMGGVPPRVEAMPLEELFCAIVAAPVAAPESA